jgi:surface antigen
MDRSSKARRGTLREAARTTAVALACVAALALAGCGAKTSSAADKAAAQALKERQAWGAQQLATLKNTAGQSPPKTWPVSGATGAEQASPPAVSSAAYAASLNPFPTGSSAWFAWGRAKEKLGTELQYTGDPKTWYGDPSGALLTHSMEPTADSLAIWFKGAYGHVAYVESVEGTTVVLDEADWYNAVPGGKPTGYVGRTESVSATDMVSRYGVLLGYIYLR